MRYDPLRLSVLLSSTLHCIRGREEEMNRSNWKEVLHHRKRFYSVHGTDKTQQTRANIQMPFSK